MRIIHAARVEHFNEYQRQFDWPGEPNCGFAFPCDEAGKVDWSKLAEIAQNNYGDCLKGMVGGKPIEDMGVRCLEWSYRHPAIGECESCKRPVTLAGFTNTCECGADYNSGGQRLAPREQWGEETGEHPADIGRIR